MDKPLACESPDSLATLFEVKCCTSYSPNDIYPLGQTLRADCAHLQSDVACDHSAFSTAIGDPK